MSTPIVSPTPTATDSGHSANLIRHDQRTRSSEPDPDVIDKILHFPAVMSGSFWFAELSGLIGRPTTADIAEWFTGHRERVAGADSFDN